MPHGGHYQEGVRSGVTYPPVHNPGYFQHQTGHVPPAGYMDQHGQSQGGALLPHMPEHQRMGYSPYPPGVQLEYPPITQGVWLG